MNPAQPDRPRHDEAEVVQCVTISYHVIAELMKHTEVLGTDDAIAVTNGLLSRLREAWTRYPQFLRAIEELRPLSKSKTGKQQKQDTIAARVEALLAVLGAVCQAFLLDFARPEPRRIGFLATRGGDS